MTRRRLVFFGPVAFTCAALVAGTGSPGCGAAVSAPSDAGRDVQAHDFVDPPPYDVPDGALVVRCDDGGLGAPDAPIACAAPPPDHCETAEVMVSYRRVNDTCDPGGRCVYERVEHHCSAFGGSACLETDAGVRCPQVVGK